MGIPVKNEEMVSVRDLARTYASLIDRLSGGEVRKLVLMKHGKMEAVVITPEEYERLLDEQSR